MFEVHRKAPLAARLLDVESFLQREKIITHLIAHRLLDFNNHLAALVDLDRAGVALPNPGSLALHRRLGFEEVGTFREYAQKNGSWISSTWFQRRVGTA